MMSAFLSARRAAFAAALLLGCTVLALPAFADSPTQVTFQANNPWTQEIGSVDERDPAHEYTVAVGAGKTFQINLVTRDPNLFFKIKDETHDKKLVDTMKTGATTWSTFVTTPTTYTIHVYVDPYAMQRGEEAKYALQVGQYGAHDMQLVATKVTFPNNAPWAQEVGNLTSAAPARDYTVAIEAGKTLKINLISHKPGLHFTVENQTENNAKLVDTATTDADTWSAPVTAAATFKIHVYTDPSALPPGKQVGYALQIGHYPTAASQPAVAGSTAAPASAASAAPASATSSL